MIKSNESNQTTSDTEKNCHVLKMNTNSDEYSLFKLKLIDQTNDSMITDSNTDAIKQDLETDNKEDDLTQSDETTLKASEANKEELVIYETSNTLYDDLNDMSQHLAINTESLPLVESCHLVNQNDISDMKLNQDVITDDKNDFDDDQQTEELIYCFEYKNDAEHNREETVSLTSIENLSSSSPLLHQETTGIF